MNCEGTPINRLPELECTRSMRLQNELDAAKAEIERLRGLLRQTFDQLVTVLDVAERANHQWTPEDGALLTIANRKANEALAELEGGKP